MASAQAFERYLLGHDPLAAGQESVWICMDDRYADIDDPYRQIPGASQGVGIDTAVAGNMDRLRYGHEPDSTPVHVVAAAVTGLAASKNILLLNHRACAAEAAAAAVSAATVERPDEVFPLAKVIMPDLDQRTYALAAAANKHTTIGQAEELTTVDEGVTWQGTAYPPVGRVSLAPMDHVATDIVANHLSGVAFDPREALQDNNPAYHISMGDLAEIHSAVKDVYPSRKRDFLAATAIRTAAISLFLPRPVPGKDLTIHRLGA